MNREILFRIYDTESKRYLTGDYSIGVESGEIRGIYGEKFPALIAEQYTGFKDKRGVPIFEGDILGDWNDIDGVMIQSKMQVFWDSKVGAWALDNSYEQDKSSGDLLSEELALFAYEVVGNVYETQQLLKIKNRGMTQQENIISAQIDGGLHEKQALLDDFAKAAMQGLIIDTGNSVRSAEFRASVADAAYDMATAMMQERERRMKG